MLLNCSYFLEPLFTYMFGLLSIIMSVREKPFNDVLLNGWFNYITSFAFGMEKSDYKTDPTKRAHILVEKAGSKCFGNAGYVINDVNDSVI